MTVDWRATLTAMDAALATASVHDVHLGRPLRDRLAFIGELYDVRFPPAPAPSTPTTRTESTAHTTWRNTTMFRIVRDLDELAARFDGDPVPAVAADRRAALAAARARLLALLAGPPSIAAVVTGSGATFPTGFTGGETLTFSLDGTSIEVTFGAFHQWPVPVIDAINEAARRLALPSNIASVVGGQIRITSPTKGAASTVNTFGGSALATLGFSALTADTGRDSVALTLAQRELIQRGLDIPEPLEPRFFVDAYYRSMSLRELNGAWTFDGVPISVQAAALVRTSKITSTGALEDALDAAIAIADDWLAIA